MEGGWTDREMDSQLQKADEQTDPVNVSRSTNKHSDTLHCAWLLPHRSMRQNIQVNKTALKHSRMSFVLFCFLLFFCYFVFPRKGIYSVTGGFF